MKILFVATVYEHITAFHIPYIEYFQRKGYEVWVAGSGSELSKQKLIDKGTLCIDIPFSRNPLSTNNIHGFTKIKRLLSENDFNLVHVHTPIASIITRFAFRKIKKGKILYTAHGFHFYKGAPLLNWFIYYPLERIAARWTDKIITINEEDYIRANKMKIVNGSVHLVHGVGVEPNACQLETFEQAILKTQIGIPEDSIVISYIAEINKNKNHKFLLNNWKRIKEKSPKAVLLIIGTGILKEEVSQLIIDEKLDDVLMLGYRNDVEKLLGISDIVTLLSYREGLPKSIMEAMVSKIPCVVSDTRGLRDLITDGKNGFVVPQGQHDLLVKSFTSLLNNKKTRDEMGKSSFQKITPYLLENVLQDYIEIYEEALQSEKPISTNIDEAIKPVDFEHVQ